MERLLASHTTLTKLKDDVMSFFFRKCFIVVRLTVMYYMVLRGVSQNFGVYVLAFLAVKSRHVVECDPRDVAPEP